MKIAVLTNEYEPNIIGGLGIVATRVAESLAARGHDVLVVTRSREQGVTTTRRNGVSVISVPKHPPYFDSAGRRFEAKPTLSLLPPDWSPDVLHVHSLQADRLALDWAHAANARLVYTCHSLIREEGLRTARQKRMEARQQRLLQTANAITSPSRWQANRLSAIYPFTAAKTFVIPNGVTTTANHTIVRANGKLLYVGRLIPSKGVEELIRGFAQARPSRPSATLELIGEGSHAYKGKLKDLSRRLQVASAVTLRGSQRHSEVLRTMRTASAVIVPSRSESFGLAALEAMAAGVPLVSTRAGGLSEFVSDDVAFVISETSPAHIAAALKKAWNRPQDARMRAARGLIRARAYTWERIVSLFEAALQGESKKTAPKPEDEED